MTSVLLPPRWPVKLAKIAALFLSVAFVLASCGSSVQSLNEDAARQFDIENNLVADLTGGLGIEQVPLEDLLRVAARAQQSGTELRIVIAAPDEEFVSAESVVDRYGGTALAYQVDRTGFQAASRDVSDEQIDQAIDAAVAGSIGDSASAFVDALEELGIGSNSTASTGSSNRAWLLWLLLPSAAFMLWGAWSYFQSRNKRIKQKVAFDERKWILTDWASKLAPEVEALRPLVAATPDSQAQTIWLQSNEMIGHISSDLESARSIGDLDVAEIRIGQTAMQLRNLRASLSA